MCVFIPIATGWVKATAEEDSDQIVISKLEKKDGYSQLGVVIDCDLHWHVHLVSQKIASSSFPQNFFFFLHFSVLYILQIISNLQLFVVITLQWLEEDFMMYLNNWEQSVKGRPGFKASEMKKMLLSSETRLGLSITGAIMFQ